LGKFTLSNEAGWKIRQKDVIDEDIEQALINKLALHAKIKMKKEMA